jgi:hypothetical protein
MGPAGTSPIPTVASSTTACWHLPDRTQVLDANGNVREGVARERDAPAGFTPDVLATFEREPELIDVVALHLVDRHFAPGLHKDILEAVGDRGARLKQGIRALEGAAAVRRLPPLPPVSAQGVAPKRASSATNIHNSSTMTTRQSKRVRIPQKRPIACPCSIPR